MSRKSPTIVSGRTIGEKREHLETKSERAAARKKDKQKKALRVSFTTVGFIILALVLVVIGFLFINGNQSVSINETISEDLTDYQPTIEVIDEDAASGNKITDRMATYIGQAEADLRALGLTPTRAVIPTGSIREVRFYLEGYSGYVKMTIDRGSGVSAEDTERLIRYLAGQGINDFEYLDVRIDGKAYWK